MNENDTLMKFVGDRIDGRLEREHDETLTEICDKAGIDDHTLRSIRRGKNCSTDSLERICGQLGVGSGFLSGIRDEIRKQLALRNMTIYGFCNNTDNVSAIWYVKRIIEGGKTSLVALDRLVSALGRENFNLEKYWYGK